MEGRKPGHHPDGHNRRHDNRDECDRQRELGETLDHRQVRCPSGAIGIADTVTLQQRAVRVSDHCHVSLLSLPDLREGRSAFGLRTGSQIPVQRGNALAFPIRVEAAMELKLVLNPAHARFHRNSDDAYGQSLGARAQSGGTE